MSKHTSQYGEDNNNYQRFEAPPQLKEVEHDMQPRIKQVRSSKPVVNDPMSSANTDD